MTRITADAELRKKLLDFRQDLEVCDETGRVVARVTPVFDLSQFELPTPMASEEELDRRSKSSERRYTTQEMLDYLGNL